MGYVSRAVVNVMIAPLGDWLSHISVVRGPFAKISNLPTQLDVTVLGEVKEIATAVAKARDDMLEV